MKRLLWLGLLWISACATGRRLDPLALKDSFDRAELGASWTSTLDAGGFKGATPGGSYRIAGGELVVDHAYNHPLWLTQPLPRDAVIEVDCWSNDANGDIKLEAWGDGRSFAVTASYTATGYVFIFGGWRNQLSALARLDEHGDDRQERSDTQVVKGRRYHFRIERRGAHLDWQIDGKPFLSFDDPSPLEGAGHSFLGFNDWEAELHFDNLTIVPL